jgi:hypothetical protein
VSRFVTGVEHVPHVKSLKPRSHIPQQRGLVQAGVGLNRDQDPQHEVCVGDPCVKKRAYPFMPLGRVGG